MKAAWETGTAADAWIGPDFEPPYPSFEGMQLQMLRVDILTAALTAPRRWGHATATIEMMCEVVGLGLAELVDTEATERDDDRGQGVALRRQTVASSQRTL